MFATLTLAEELEVSGRDLLLPATYDLIWAAVCLAIIAYVLLKKALPAFTKVLDERSAKIEAGLAYAETAQEQAREAEEERRAIVDAARSDAATAREAARAEARSEEHTSELQSRGHLVCRLLLEKKKK